MTQAFDTSARVSKHLTCGLVLCMHVEDAIGVHVEADVDLGNPPRRRGDPAELKLAQLVVVAGAAALALVYLDQHPGLVVRVRAEGLYEQQMINVPAKDIAAENRLLDNRISESHRQLQ